LLPYTVIHRYIRFQITCSTSKPANSRTTSSITVLSELIKSDGLHEMDYGLCSYAKPDRLHERDYGLCMMRNAYATRGIGLEGVVGCNYGRCTMKERNTNVEIAYEHLLFFNSLYICSPRWIKDYQHFCDANLIKLNVIASLHFLQFRCNARALC
jgi:hypothetical protein